MASSPSDTITRTATSWPGVTAGTGRRGEFAFRVGRREIGHLHGDHAAHFSFPKEVWAELYEQGRIRPHPVFPDKPGPAARRIEDDDDVRDVIALLRLNYDRAVANHGVPLEQPVPGLLASRPQPLPFGPDLDIRAFVLRRGDRGDVLVYSTTTLDGIPQVARHYLNHHHEALFPTGGLDAPLFVHDAGRAAVEQAYAVRATFSRRHSLDDDFEVIPTPGHTPDATAFLWDSGEHRVLFTGDTIYLDDGEWIAAVLDSSDRAAYLESLALIRDLDFDVLVPWAATRGQPYVAMTGREDAQRRIDWIIERVRDGGRS